jgi:very-short-patch-repair endonuclease
VRQELHDSHAFLDARGDEAVAALAARQHGVVSVAQLRAAGLGRGAIAHRVRRRRLLRLHRGVYAVGHARLTARGRLWAAVLACGGEEAAVVSHRSAAAVWELAPAPWSGVDVITLGQSRSVAGVRVHRSGALEQTDVVHGDDGLPVTSVARTLLDLAALLPLTRLERACHQAEILRVLDLTAVEELLERSGPARGTRALRAALTSLAATGAQVTRSELEVRFLSLVAEAALPRPRVNAHVAGFEVDFHWPERRLVVETDGVAVHMTPTAFEADRRRDAALAVAGQRVVRFTWRQLTDRPATVKRTLVALLG